MKRDDSTKPRNYSSTIGRASVEPRPFSPRPAQQAQNLEAEVEEETGAGARDFWNGLEARAARIRSLQLGDLPSVDEEEVEDALDDPAGGPAGTFGAPEFWAGVIRRIGRIGSLPVSQRSLDDESNARALLPATLAGPIHTSVLHHQPRRRASIRRSSLGEATRERILEAAARAFDRRGYLGVSLNSVVQELGLTRGALYHFFPTKQRLAAEIVRRHFAAWERLAASIVAEHDNLVDALIDMSYWVARGFQADSFTRAANRLINERNLVMTELPPPFEGWIERVTQLLERAKARGQARADVDSAAAAELMVSFFHGTQAVSQQLTDRQDLLSRLDKLWELVEPTLRPPPPPRASGGTDSGSDREGVSGC